MNKWRNGFVLLVLSIVFGCASSESRLKTKILTDVCIKPFIDYRYLTCCRIKFMIDDELFEIPSNFKTDLASIPKIAWPMMAPAHSSLISAAIIHDWFYRKTCDFTRLQADLIFYHMLRNNGMSKFRSSIMYYAVRLFGWNYYNEDYCEEEFKGMDKTSRGLKITPLY